MKLALGTVQFGLAYGVANQYGQVSSKEVNQILKLANEMGVDTLDTAIGYGESEKVLGELGVDDFKLVTKLPILPDEVSDVDGWIESQMADSLARLGVQMVYGVLLHRSEDLLGDKGKHVIRSLERLKSNGIAKKIGISIYDPSELEHVLQAVNIDIVQAPLNLVDRRLETSGWLKRLNSQSIEVHTRSTFLQGLLLMPRSEIPKKFERWNNLWDIWHTDLSKYQCSAMAACLSYPISLSEVDKVVVGVDNKHQLEELIHITKTNITSYDWSAMMSDEDQLINPYQWDYL